MLAFLTFAVSQTSTPQFECPLELALNLPIIEIPSVRGQKLRMIVDTGAGRSVIDPTWADKFGLADGGPITASGTGGDVKARNVRGFQVRLGEESIVLPAIALPLSAIALGLNTRLDGILGYDFFVGRVIELDYASNKLRSYASNSYKPEPDLMPVEVAVDGGRPMVHADIDISATKSARGYFLFDTGANDSASLSEAFAVENKLELSPGRLAGGVGGIRSSKRTQIQGIRLGKAKFDLKFVSVDPSNRIGRTGLIGSGLLQGRRVIVDYGRNRIYLSRNPFLDGK